MQDAIQQAIPPTPPPADPDADYTRCATDLIVRWEVGSPSQYTRKYQGVVWPGGHSGPTWAIGYDGGQATRPEIRLDWAEHPDVDRLVTTSGVAGGEARARVRAGEWSGILTPYAYAERVFAATSLPAYTAAARRRYGPAFDRLPVGAKCGLVGNGYNRGFGIEGPRRTEIYTLVTVCVPAGDLQCIATNLESQCRLWPDTPGLCARRRDEARVTLTWKP